MRDGGNWRVLDTVECGGRVLSIRVAAMYVVWLPRQLPYYVPKVCMQTVQTNKEKNKSRLSTTSGSMQKTTDIPWYYKDRHTESFFLMDVDRV